MRGKCNLWSLFSCHSMCIMLMKVIYCFFLCTFVNTRSIIITKRLQHIENDTTGRIIYVMPSAVAITLYNYKGHSHYSTAEYGLFRRDFECVRGKSQVFKCALDLRRALEVRT